MKARSQAEFDIDCALGIRLRLARQNLGMNMTEVGAAAGISQQQLGQYEQGNDRVSVSRLYSLAAKLETTAERLIVGLDGRQRPQKAPLTRESALYGW